MSYYVHPTQDGKAVGVQSDNTTLVSSEINYTTGRAKGVGSLASLLTTLGLYNSQDDIYGSQVVIGSGGDVVAALTGASNTFAYTVGHVIRRVSSTINGVTNTVLQHGGSDYGWRHPINQTVSVRSYLVATAIRNGQWVSYSGIWSTDPTAQDDFATFVAQSGDGAGLSLDEAANPSGAVPGELVYRDGSPKPVQADYSAKTSW